MKNEYGREWEELDALKWHAAIHTHFVVVDAEGIPLCGRYVEGQPKQVIVDQRWRA